MFSRFNQNVLLYLVTVVILVLKLVYPSATFAQDAELPIPSKEEFLKAEVLQIVEEGENEISGKKYPYQIVKLKPLDESVGPEVTVDHGQQFSIVEDQKVKVGEKVVLLKISASTGDKVEVQYQIIDKYRLPQVEIIALIFAGLVLILSGLRGLGSLVGLAISLMVIIFFIVPQILKGHEPLLIIASGAYLIALTTIYLAHGFSKRTSVALISTILTLTIVILLSYMFVKIARLSGLGSEDANSLRFGVLTANINFGGLLLGGIIIGSLGVLDDITTSLSAAIFELKRANEKLKFKNLLASGLSIGREHISSLVNTLLLAYAGASLPIFLFIVINPTNQPLWFILNSEIIMEEAIRTLSGSFGLVLAVPITAFLASIAAEKSKK